MNSGIHQAWQGGAAATLELACNVNTTVNVYTSLYPTHIYDKHTKIFSMLQEEDDDEDIVWTSNKWSTVKTEKSTITILENNSNKRCSYKKDIPLHTRTLQVDRIPAQHKTVQTNHLGNLPATCISFFPTKMKEEAQYAISDLGATGHFLVHGAPVVNKKITSSPYNIHTYVT